MQHGRHFASGSEGVRVDSLQQESTDENNRKLIIFKRSVGCPLSGCILGE